MLGLNQADPGSKLCVVKYMQSFNERKQSVTLLDKFLTS